MHEQLASLERAREGAASAGGAFTDLGPVEAIPLGEGRVYCVGRRTLAVFRPRDGRLYAMENRCPHRGGPLADGIVGGGVVICPLHGWKFDLASGRCANEGLQVKTYPAALIDGRIRVLIGEEP